MLTRPLHCDTTTRDYLEHNHYSGCLCLNYLKLSKTIYIYKQHITTFRISQVLITRLTDQASEKDHVSLQCDDWGDTNMNPI
jgi:hypothetical protein